MENQQQIGMKSHLRNLMKVAFPYLGFEYSFNF